MKASYTFLTGGMLLFALLGCASQQTSARQETTAIPELPPYEGPRASVLIDEFEWNVPSQAGSVEYELTGSDGQTQRMSWSVRASNLAGGLEQTLKASLVESKRFRVSDRRCLKRLKDELALQEEGLMDASTGPKKGDVQSADLIVRGTVLEWDDASGGSGGVLGGWVPKIPFVGGIGFKTQKGKCVIQLDLVDADSLEVLATKQCRGDASSRSFTLAGIGWMPSMALGGILSEYEKTPMGDAIRQAIAEAVRVTVDAIPGEYYRH